VDAGKISWHRVSIAGTPKSKKKADVIKHPWVLNHVGLPCIQSPGLAEVPFI
jgi:hypothetical protein